MEWVIVQEDLMKLKLKTKISLTFLSILLLITLTFGILIYQIFLHFFQMYLADEQEIYFQQIITDISSLTKKNNALISNEDLNIYANGEHLKLIISDLENNTVAEYNGLDEDESPDIVSVYKIIDSNRRHLGYISISYDDHDYAYTEAYYEFSERASFALVMLFIAFTIIIIAVSMIISRAITGPIAKISESTKHIYKRNYDVPLQKTNVIEIEELNENIKQLALKLKEQEYIRTQYASDISHELRTPITNLRLHLEAIQDGMIDIDDDAISVLIQNTSELEQITEKLKGTFQKDFSKERGKFINIDLSITINKIIDGLEPMIKAKNCTLIRSIENGINYKTDPQLISHIVTNLITNAVKAIDENGRIRIELNRVKNSLVLRVKDNGVGIPKSSLSHIFDRFYRVDNSRNRSSGGSGLGLAIVKNIVTELNGEITADSVENEGSTFTVFLPLIVHQE